VIRMSVSVQVKGSEICPSCGADMGWDEEYIVWCEACEYNINPSHNQEYVKKLDLIYEKLGRRFGESMLHQVSERQSLRPGFSFARLAAFVLASAVHMVSLFFLFSSIYFISQWQGSIWFAVLGLFLLGLSWVTRPRFGKLDVSEKILFREELPELYNIVDKLCETAGIRPIDGIIIDHRFNASVRNIGIRGKRILTIGLPLFTILPKEERIALLGHEIGHFANNDVARSVFVGGAIDTLAIWHDLLDVHHVDEIEGIFGIISGFFMKGLALIPYGLYMLIIHLLWHEKQRAEYYADLVGAQVSGTKSAISLMEKVQFDQLFYHVVRKSAVTNNSSNLLEHFRKKVEELPDKEFRRLKRVSELELSKLNCTHPPNAYRIQFLNKQNHYSSRISLTVEQNEKINRELAMQEERIQDTLVGEYLGALY
jgi:Zn-dependent protease with chaperone function